jgi:hypothetical protein
MLEILEDYMRVSATPEANDDARKACDHLEDFGLPDWDIAVTDVLMTLDHSAIDEDMDQILGLLRQLLINIMANFRIQVSEDITLSQLNDLLDVIRQVEATEDTDTVLQLLGDAADPVEAFCNVVSFFRQDCADNYYPIIHGVQPETIEVIRQLMIKENTFRLPESTVDVDRDRQFINRIKGFEAFCEKESLLVVNMIREGARLGQPFEHYFTALAGYINQQRHQDAALEFVAMALVSAEFEQPRDIIMQWLNKQYADVTVITRIMMAVQTILMQWHSHGNRGVRVEPA